MQFNATDTGLYQDFLFLTNTDSNRVPVATFTPLANRHYYAAVIEIFKSSSDWDWDDSNHTDLPIATTTLVASQGDYTIPSNALKIQRAEVLDSAGNYQLLKPIDESQVDIALDEFMENDGLPEYYRLLKGSIFLYPAPAAASVTTTAGLKLYYSREVDEFTSADTTQEPGFAEPYHRLISLGAAYDWGVSRGRANVQILKLEYEQLMESLRAFYGRRHQNFKHRIRPHKENYA